MVLVADRPVLEVEGLAPKPVASFSPVEAALRRLRSYGPRSFASLTLPDGSYVQMLGGPNPCIVEHRDAAGVHRRARWDIAKVPFTGPLQLHHPGGVLIHDPEDVLFIDHAVAVFRAFYEGAEFPLDLRWRDITDDLL